MTWSLKGFMALPAGELTRLFACGAPEEALPDPNDWLTLVEALTQAVDSPTMDSADRGREIEALVCVLNAAEQAGGLERSEVTIRRLNVVAALIGLDETPAGTLSPESAAESFLAEVPYSLPDATALAQDWRSLDLRTIKKLRFIKNMLMPLHVIEESLPAGEVRTAVRNWLRLSKALP